ncbi:MAG: thermonuclease family protein, partial [Candidatus Omnitrophica bacterium]|nr:thermonuclease family protein [Candidatus Omnitrophota bacterium]
MGVYIITRAATLSIFFLGITAVLSIAGTHQVLRVIDGDTLIIEDGRRIQLLGVDAPEINDRLGWNQQQADRVRIDVSKVNSAALKSKEFIEQIIDGNAVEVDLDTANFNTQSKDAYNRTLAYVYIKT